MHAHIKYALIATGVVLAVVGLLNLKCPRQRPATLSQVPPPVDERAAFDALVEEYISKNSPQAVDKKIAEALSTSVRRLEGNVMTLDRAQVERALTILARNQPSQIAADFLNEVISAIQTSTDRSLVKEVSEGIQGKFGKAGYSQYVQVLFVLFHRDSSKVTLALKASQREGSFMPVHKKVTERICKKKWFGVVEECRDVEKIVQVPREVTEELLASAKDYVKSLLLKDLSNSRSIIADTKRV